MLKLSFITVLLVIPLFFLLISRTCMFIIIIFIFIIVINVILKMEDIKGEFYSEWMEHGRHK